jgi:hypothetical protein
MGAEEDATARRERLKALRAAKELLSAPDAAPAAEQQYGLPFLSSRSPTLVLGVLCSSERNCSACLSLCVGILRVQKSS